MKVLEGLSNAEIINILYGRLLRIISNKGLNNKNTNYTESAVDIGRFLINTLVLNEYNQYTKITTAQAQSNSSPFNSAALSAEQMLPDREVSPLALNSLDNKIIRFIFSYDKVKQTCILLDVVIEEKIAANYPFSHALNFNLAEKRR